MGWQRDDDLVTRTIAAWHGGRLPVGADQGATMATGATDGYAAVRRELQGNAAVAALNDDLAALRAAVARLEGELRAERESHERTGRELSHAVKAGLHLREIVELIDTGDPTTGAPEDGEVYHLCARWGYGAVMAAAARLWARRDAGGALTVGPCRGTVRAALGVRDGA